MCVHQLHIVCVVLMPLLSFLNLFSTCKKNDESHDTTSSHHNQLLCLKTFLYSVLISIDGCKRCQFYISTHSAWPLSTLLHIFFRKDNYYSCADQNKSHLLSHQPSTALTLHMLHCCACNAFRTLPFLE